MPLEELLMPYLAGGGVAAATLLGLASMLSRLRQRRDARDRHVRR